MRFAVRIGDARIRCAGCHSVPPFANAAYALASCNGVTTTSPWPTADRMSSAGYHDCCRSVPSWSCSWRAANADFHAGSGTRPVASSSSMPVGAPKPERPRLRLDAEAPLVRRRCSPDLPELVADRVEVRVARDGERLLEVHRAEHLVLSALWNVVPPISTLPFVGVVVADAADRVAWSWRARSRA